MKKKNTRNVLWECFVNTLNTLDEELFDNKGFALECCPVLEDNLSIFASNRYKDVDVYVEYNNVSTEWRPEGDECDKEDAEIMHKAGKVFVSITNLVTYERKTYYYKPGTCRQDGEFFALVVDRVKEMAEEPKFDDDGVSGCIEAIRRYYSSLANT